MSVRPRPAGGREREPRLFTMCCGGTGGFRSDWDINLLARNDAGRSTALVPRKPGGAALNVTGPLHLIGRERDENARIARAVFATGNHVFPSRVPRP